MEPDGDIRDGAWVAELAGDCLTGWPRGMRLIVRKERPHPGAQLRFTDADGMRLTCFATNTAGEATAALELRHRQRARAEDRIRAARATGLDQDVEALLAPGQYDHRGTELGEAFGGDGPHARAADITKPRSL